MQETTKSWIESGEAVLMPTYRRLPLVLTQGEGATVSDLEGKSYLDFVSGIAVNALGHCEKSLVEAIQGQAGRLLHVSNLYHTLPQIELAQQLVQHSFADKVFFCNSGAEAVEAAIKLARKHVKEQGETRRFEIITAEGSFHGRTMAALSATGQPKFHTNFDPLLPGFQYIPFDDADALQKAITPRTAAVLLEPIQGEGGVRVPKPGYLAEVRKICDEAGLLMILDEVQSGIGRTGRLFAYEHEGIAPDIMTLAKGLGGGLPIGALLAREDIAQAFQPGSHASTFGGNPLSCAAGLAVFDRICDGDFLKAVRQKGEALIARLRDLQEKSSLIRSIRGRGLMVALDLEIPAASVIEAGLEKGVLFNHTSENTLRLIPPLTIERTEIDQMLAVLTEILREQA